MKKLLFTLRRVRGAIGSYQGPPGAPCTAPDVLPTPTDGSDGSPGGGKGLILNFIELIVAILIDSCNARFQWFL